MKKRENRLVNALVEKVTQCMGKSNLKKVSKKCVKRGIVVVRQNWIQKFDI